MTICRHPTRPPQRGRTAAPTWIGVALLLAVAALFRLWQIDNIPPGLFGDEAADGLDALDVLAGRGQIFFPSNFGREGLHMWILAASFRLLGITPLAVRIPSAIAGITTVLATLWLGRELFAADRQRPAPGEGQTVNGERRMEPLATRHSPLAIRPSPLTTARWTQADTLAPWLAALYIATSYWHVHFSRFGIRGVFTPLMTALATAALWRAVNRRSWAWFAVGGACMGLGAHFYAAGRFVPVFVGTFLVLQLLAARLGRPGRTRPAILTGQLAGVAIFFAVSALVFAPLGHYFLTHPGSFTERAREVSAFQGGFDPSSLATIARATWANLIQFVAPQAGDQARFYNLPGRAVFDPLNALLALLGLGIALWRWRRPGYLFLLVWFGAMLIPSFLAVDRYPTLPRVLGVIPGVYFFPAIGLAALVHWLAGQPGRRLPRSRVQTLAALLLVTVTLLGHAGLTCRDYFTRWGTDAATQDAFEADMVAAWRWLQDNPHREVYLSSDIYRHPTFMFLHERVPTTRYFTHINPGLHWFDARRAWPFPPADSPAVQLLTAPSMPPAYIARFVAARFDTLVGTPQQPLLSLGHSAAPSGAGPEVAFSDNLRLLSHFVLEPPELSGQAVLVQMWRVGGPETANTRGYQIQSGLVDQQGQQVRQVSDEMGYRPIEWATNDIFLTWQAVEWPDAGQGAIVALALRVVNFANGVPLQPAGATEGWVHLPSR